MYSNIYNNAVPYVQRCSIFNGKHTNVFCFYFKVKKKLFCSILSQFTSIIKQIHLKLLMTINYACYSICIYLICGMLLTRNLELITVIKTRNVVSFYINYVTFSIQHCKHQPILSQTLTNLQLGNYAAHLSLMYGLLKLR